MTSARAKDVTPHVAVFILNYNNAQDTLECLQSLTTSAYPLDVFLADNSSQENTSEIETLLYQLPNLSPNISQVHFMQNSDNLGFAGGLNPIIEVALQSPSDYTHFWLLNNDTQIEAQTLTHLLQEFQSSPSHGLVGSCLKYPDGQIQTLGAVHINPFWGTTSYIKNIQDLNQMSYLNGASLLIKREVFESVGLLPTQYFLYFEEVDYCYQAKAKGFTLGVAVDSIVIHKEGASTQPHGQLSPRLDALMISNRLIFHRRFLPSLLGRYLGLIVTLFLRLLRRQWKSAAFILRACLSTKQRSNIIKRLQIPQ